MDGVIADFFSALAEFRKVNHWKDQGEITLDTSIKDLRGTNFFETLPVFPYAKKLIDLVKSYTGGDYYINTSPLRDDLENSRKYKTKWLEKHDFKPNDIIVTKRILILKLRMSYRNSGINNTNGYTRAAVAILVSTGRINSTKTPVLCVLRSFKTIGTDQKRPREKRYYRY